MGKAKKRKVADFHKPKLKVGKRKPTGTNVTNTAFKTSQINITSQLEETNDPKTKRNQSLKDLLSQLNHYNATVRHEACIGFRDLFQAHPEIMHEEINNYIPKLLDKMVDLDAAVRHSFTLCIQHITRKLPVNEISPFVHIIVAHICCGMTHINEGVQMDSLSILELILEHFPRLMIHYRHKILPSLIELVSKKGQRGTSSSQTLNMSKVKGISSFVSRDISINVEGKMSSLKARTKILSKLQKILSILFEEIEIQQNEELNDFDRKTIYVGERPVFAHIKKSCNYSERPLNSWLEIAAKESRSKNQYALEFFHDIYPVLLNSWIEFEPGQLASGLNDSSSLRASLPGLCNIVGILDVFISLCTKNNSFSIFRDEGQFKEFCTHFLKFFSLPVTFTNVKSIAKQETTNNIQRFAIDFNFVMAKIVCKLFLHTTLLTDGKQRIRYLKQLMVFCNDILENSGLLPKEKISNFIKIFEDIMKLKHCLLNKEKDYIDCNMVIQSMIQCYSHGSVMSPWKIPLLCFFKSLCCSKDSNWVNDQFNHQLKSFIKIVVRNFWSLPPTATKLVKYSIDFVKTVSVYKFCTNAPLAREVEKSLLKITEVTGGLHQHLDESTLKTLIEIIYTMPSLSTKLIRNLAILCLHQKIPLNTKKYIISMITLSLQKPSSSLKIEDFINFILTIVTNYTQQGLKDLPTTKERVLVRWSILNLYNDNQENTLADYAIKQLQSLNNYTCLFDKMMVPIGNILSISRHLPVSTAYGFIRFVSSLAEWGQETTHELNQIENLTISSAINQVADLVSAVLLHFISPTYKSLVQTPKEEFSCDDSLQFELVSTTVTLLSDNELILRQLVKKWINIVREYDMDGSCVISIAEVLMSLLQEPELNDSLRSMKAELLSIANIQMNASTRFNGVEILKQLRFVVGEFWS